MNRFRLNEEYPHSTIEAMANGADYEVVEHGPDIIGESFLCLRPNEDVAIPFVVSFIMTAFTIEAHYTCIYSDFEKHSS